ncbi:MAG: DUF1501 domain-containing protein [Acidimicrobiia bacterium]
MTVRSEILDDLALARLSRPATLPGGLSRRRFLQLAGVGAGAAAVSPLLSSLEAFAAPPLGANDGVLVLIMMEGGNDGLNMVVPTGESHYYALRPQLAIPAANALPIGTGVGLHPSLFKLKQRFDQGDVAVVRGVGYGNPDLSHFTSMGIWMNGWAGGSQPGGATGWIGRYMDGLPNAASESLYGAVIGTSVPLHMVGAVARASGLPQSIGDAFGIDRRDPNDVRMFDAVGAFSGGATGLGQWGELAAKVEHDTLDLSQRIQPAYQGTFPDSDLGRQLVLTARLINANLGVRVFSTNIGGFDNHSDEPNSHAQNLADLDAAIDAFYANLSSTWRGRVTLMTFSEFGRRPEQNDTIGTDHGTASPLFVVGQRVKGGLYGAQPLTTKLDANGNLKYQVDFRQVYATILDTWLKADSKQVLGYQFSNLGLFDGGPTSGTTTSSRRPHRVRRLRV